jgi:NAD(P)-dependent dehydrogenase (short-subunit alcohol dehydrogenase family)
MASVDVVIHCAAVMGPIGLATEVDAQDWFDALKTDLFGAFLVTKHVVPLMRPESRPRILLLSGGGAFDPMPNLSAYGVSKAGIVRLAETLAAELAPRNIAVNVFAPGFVATEIFDTMLKAGRERGGKLYDTVMSLLDNWDSNKSPIMRQIPSDARALTGKRSACFDPWDEASRPACQISSDRGSMRRSVSISRISRARLLSNGWSMRWSGGTCGAPTVPLPQRCHDDHAESRPLSWVLH